MSELFIDMCSKGKQLSDIQELCLTEIIPSSARVRGFDTCCRRGHLAIASWLYSQENIRINIDNLAVYCGSGQLEIVQWIYSLKIINIHAHNDIAFIMACSEGKLDVAKWLYSIGDTDIHTKNDTPFKWSFYCGHRNITKWLLEIGQFSNDLINNLISEFPNHCDKPLIKLLYTQRYVLTHPLMRAQYKLIIRERIMYYKSLIKMIGHLSMLYNTVCQNRYSFGGIGYDDALEHFNYCVQLNKKLN